MNRQIQRRAGIWQFLLSSLILLCAQAGFATAEDLSEVPFGDLLQDVVAYKQDEVIVRFVEEGLQPPSGPEVSGPRTRRAIRTAVTESIISGAAVHKEYDCIVPGLALVKLSEGTSVLDAVIQLNRSANVLYAEPNYKYKLFVVPNDPHFSNQWGLHNTGQTDGAVDADIDAPEAWDIQVGSSDVIVAVTDSGVDYDHPDLAANMWMNIAEGSGSGTPGVDDDDNGYIDDVYGYDFAGGDADPADDFFHGTHVAGVIGARGNNATGISGVCWNIKIMALKVGVGDEVSLDAVLEAIDYANAMGAKVINASLGGYDYSQALRDAIDAARTAGVLFVAAAGNDLIDNDEFPLYPASYRLGNIVSVMATDHNDQMSWFSNYGAGSVSVGAPGTGILSTFPTYDTTAMNEEGYSTDYETISGTSMAAPHVAGACALIWSQYPSLPYAAIKHILMQTVDPVLPGLCSSGGRINLHKALTLVPSGEPGRVLNTRDDPNDPDSFYSSIQSAIDDANDGDVLIAESINGANTVFFENIDFHGKAITLRSGDVNHPDDPTLSPESTFILGLEGSGSVVTFRGNEGSDTVLKGFTISWGNADYGGGIACDGASPTITDCIVSNNMAKYYGGGIDCYQASPTITNCTITGNRAFGSSGIGGGINCEEGFPEISHCNISNNFANSVGGGVGCYYASPTIFNCFIINNSTAYQSGGVDCEFSSPIITNCTVAVDDSVSPKSGGIFAYRDSFPVITNCILWGNGDDLYDCSATYCCIEDDDSGVGNIHSNPLFVTGPRGGYYLSQIDAGQLSDSPCVDAGDPNTTDPVQIQMQEYTTRTDGDDADPNTLDVNTIDIGAHYSPTEVEWFQLNVSVIGGNGSVTVDPNKDSYPRYAVVQLRAHPETGYRIKAWTGTDDDSSTEPNNTVTIIGDSSVFIEFEEIPLYQLRTSVVGGNGTISPEHRRGEYYPDGTVVTLAATPNPTYVVERWIGTDDDTSWSNTNTVTMDSDKEVTVEFRQSKSLYVPGQYHSISRAIEAAYQHGDKVVVAAGTYNETSLDFGGKAITVASEHPDDPCCIAATIIDCRQSGRAFIFQNGEGPDSVVDGLTIINGSAVSGPNTPINTGGTGADGEDALGGAVACFNGSSPTLSNLVIKNCIAQGRNGEDATFIFDPPAPPPDPPDPPEALEPLPDPAPPEPNPVDPNAPVDGVDGADGADGAPGAAGPDGTDGLDGFDGGDAGNGYGGAMYFDANSSPTILHCTIINCRAIGGDGGFGGQGQDGQDGGAGQDGQPGQDGQNGGEGINDGEQGTGGNGGAGGDGGNGGNGGAGGRGGDGGDGGEALSGAIYFGPNCHPTIQYCTIMDCSTRQGLGNAGGAGGNGGNAGDAGAGAAGGSGGTPDGEDGADGSDGAGGAGGIGGDGGNMGYNGKRSWAGAIFYGENCEVEVSDTVISNNQTTTIVPTYAYAGGNGGNGGNGGDVGGAGGAGGNGGIGQPPGNGGNGGAGGEDGSPGPNGAAGFTDSSYTTSYGGANYYEPNCTVELTDCIISYNLSEGHDGGGEDYKNDCTAIVNRCEFIGNSANYDGGGQCFDGSCSVEVNDCNFVDNIAWNDGGGLYCWYDCSLGIDNSRFTGNSAFGYVGSGGGVYGGGAWDWWSEQWYNGGEVSVRNSHFKKNEAAFGGGLYWYGNEAEVAISGCIINDNIAEHGGGLFWSDGVPAITGCSVRDNTAAGSWIDLGYGEQFGKYFYGGGGGMFCWSSAAEIKSCFISGNSASGSGGGVYLGGDPGSPILRNCLVKDNSAVIDGGGIVCYWSVAPIISNCTIVDNNAYDFENSSHGRGGGLSCSYESQTNLIDSILWGNTGISGNQIAIGSDSDPVYMQRPATLTVSYCDIQGSQDPEAIYVEPGRTLNWGPGSIDADPLFVGPYYLSQIAAGQSVDSPCIDVGSDLAANLGLDEFTTRSDGVSDEGTADIGLHYPTERYQLTVNVVGGVHGSVDPNGGFFGKYTVVTLTATVDSGYRVRWIGTDDDSSFGLTNTVTMYSDRTVTAIIEQPTTIKVPGDYPLIQEAVDAASDGDVIVINKGNYGEEGITIDKAITLTSTNPDDPCCVAETVINGIGRPSAGIALSSNCGPDTVINGLTFANHGWGGYTQPSPSGPGDDGYDGGGGEGGTGIYIESGASPTIVNCIVRDCTIFGGHASSGNDGDEDPNDPDAFPPWEPGDEHGGDGGDGGTIFGGGIYCGQYSSPTIRNCQILNCTILAGNAGNGGEGVSPDDEDALPTPNGGDGGIGGRGGSAYGGGIYVGYGSTPKIEGCVITNCSAIAGNAGDAGDGGDGADNYAGGNGGNGGENGQAYGGGIYFADRVNATISDCEIIDCNATAGGAGDGGDYGGTVGNWGIGGNGGGYFGEYWKDSAYGGGVYCGYGSRITFENCTFSNNAITGSMSGRGGLNIASRQEPWLAYVVPSYGAGVFYEANSQPTFIGCKLIGNHSNDVYPILGPDDPTDPTDPNYVDPNVPAYRLNPYISYGGGICYIDVSSATITDCDFSDNYATVGGGLYLDDANTVITGSSFANNSAFKGGGVYGVDSLALTISESMFTSNQASQPGGEGGGIYCSSIPALIADCEIEDNYAYISGGGMYLSGGASEETTVKNCLITNNSAVRDGGGISCNWHNELTIRNSTIAENQATGAFAYGGGLYCSYSSLAQVIDSIIWGNISSYEGSQIAVSSSDPAYPLPSTVNITYSDIEPEPNDVGLTGLDVVFCIDTTVSMFNEIDAIKNAMTEIINRIAERSTDFRIGAVEYRDYPVPPSNDPNTTTDPNMWFIYRDVSQFTNDVNTLVTDINNIVAEDGHDNSAVYMALMHCIDAESVRAVLDASGHSDWVLADSPGPGEWRSEESVGKMIILIGDLGPTDPEPHSDYTFNDIVAAANAKSIQIFSIATSEDVTYAPYTLPISESFRDLAAGTGGMMFDAAADPSQVVDAIMEAIQLAARVAPMIYVEDTCVLSGWDVSTQTWDPDTHNISEDPRFVDGYFLSQVAAGQDVSSPCVDAGSADASDPSVGLDPDKYTTRTDSVGDFNIIDMGYHYPLALMSHLIVSVVDANGVVVDPSLAHGYVDPNDRFYPTGIVAELVAHPDSNYRIKAWSGTNDDSSMELTNTVTMSEDRYVTVQFEPDLYQLTTLVAGGHGTVEPTSGPQYAGVVQLIAHPEPGYRVKSWSGTDNDPSWNRNNNTVLLDSDKTIIVKFEPDVARNLLVPSGYRTIEEAVAAAGPGGDNIIVSKGIHYVTAQNGIDLAGKNITLMSTDPNDPAATIIDCNGTRYEPRRAFHFHSGEDANTVVIGFTIRNGYMRGPEGDAGRFGILTPEPFELILVDDPDPNTTPPRAERGRDITGYGYGGGILCENASSPTIKNCIITNCIVTGGQGGDGAPGQVGTWEWQPENLSADMQDSDNGQWGGYGGAGYGVGYGGAIACLGGSCPAIINCTIKDNTAAGGRGGDGGGGGFALTEDEGQTYEGLESSGGGGGDAYGRGVGGGIYCENGSTPVIMDCNFVNNVARPGIPGLGGAVGEGDASDPPATEGLGGFIFPAAGIAGGAAYCVSADSNFTNCGFLGNQAYEAFATIDVYGRYAEILEYTVGGALYSGPGNTANLSNCEFIGNLGGALYCSSDGVLNVGTCIFKGNSGAVEGGAICVADRCYLDVNDCSFINNSVSGDGGAVRSESNADFANCSFSANIAGDNGGAIHAYLDTGDPNTRTILTLNFNSCIFAGNQAFEGVNGYGGSIHFQDFNSTFTDCYFTGNIAKNGGGLFFAGGVATLTGTIINRNRAIGGDGIGIGDGFEIGDGLDTNRTFIGGGLVCADTEVTIENCTLQDNAADGFGGSGGAINFYGGYVTHIVKNCLITGNSAIVSGGAISCNLFAKPEIKNCTFSGNTAGSLGGAIFCDWSSDTIVSDSIFQACTRVAIVEEDFGDAIVKYCLFDDNPDGDYGVYDTVTEQTDISAGVDLDATNLQADPLFVASPFGDYYLSQIAAGQAAESPAVDAGSALASAVNMNSLSTRTDDVNDTGIVDIGYHYGYGVRLVDIPQYKLTLTVIDGHGTVEATEPQPLAYEPETNTYTYYSGALVTVTAKPEAGWRVAEWSGTINDASRALTNIVFADLDKEVSVRFDQPRTIWVGSDPNYTTIQHAIDEAVDGDIVILPTGTYIRAVHAEPKTISIVGKDITVTSTNPDDPCCVAATVIEDYTFYISNVGPDTVIDGLTFSECFWAPSDAVNPPGDPVDGPDGGIAEGGAMQLYYASPTVRNCVFTGCYVIGSNGAPGDNGNQAHPEGLDGGWPGWAYGGAIYCTSVSSPTFQNCSFTDCFARGGNGGDGGDGYQASHGGRGGGWEWAESVELELASVWWDGWEWGDKLIGDPYDAYIYPYYRYSGYGGAVFCEYSSSPNFVDCTFTNNHAYGGVCGVGGSVTPTPDRNLKIEACGGAVYACYGSNPEFVRCVFSGNSADPSNDYINNADEPATVQGNDDPYISYGGTIAFEDDCSPTFTNCAITNSEACIGGAMWWSNSTVTIEGCSLSDSTAYHGAGLHSVDSTGTIKGSTITRNYAVTATDPNIGLILGQGGGYCCLTSTVEIADSSFTENQATGSGGAIYFGGSDMDLDVMPLLHNCLVTSNIAGRDGGGVSSNWLAEPIISNCTIADNEVSNAAGYGGGLYCSYDSNTTVIDSIIWDNVSANGPQIAVATSFEYEPRPSKLSISYSDIQGGVTAAFVDVNCTLGWGVGNVESDPIFVAGPLGNYYLSQIAAGQLADSPCLDTGSADVNSRGLSEYTTRTDSVNDVGIVDMGYHYSFFTGPTIEYSLEIFVVGNGTIEPSPSPEVHTYAMGTVVALLAIPDPNHRVIEWAGTDDDSSTNLINTVTMDSDKVVVVEFGLAGVSVTINVPGDYPTLWDAVSEAKDGDTIVVDPGTYYGGYESYALVVDKSVLITSRNPDDPCCVAATIIDGYLGSNEFHNIGIVFESSTDANTVLNGFTIQNCGGRWGTEGGEEGDRDANHPNGYDGSCGEGAAMIIMPGASPIIKNCIIRNNLVIGGDGGAGVGADDENNAGRGGWAGWAHGGAVYCGANSSPTFINCRILNNEARGGDGGNGGDWQEDGGMANYGGNWSINRGYNIDPNSLGYEYVDGDLWEVWEWDYALTYWPMYGEFERTSYFGDYRWYSGYGGGVFCDIESNVTFTDCEISGNRAYGGMSGQGGVRGEAGRQQEPLVPYEIPSYGGGVYCAAATNITFTDCTFEDNIASEVSDLEDPNHRLNPYAGYGGGVCAEGSASVVFIDCNFIENEADSGGGLYVDDANATIIDCNFVSNTALRGGGFLGMDGSIGVFGCDITNNTAFTDVNDPNDDNVLAIGAGLCCWSADANIYDCNISGNIADASGGGVYFRGGNAPSFVNCLVTNNAAGRDGGGISINWYAEPLIANCTFVGNAAPGTVGDADNAGLGGGLYCAYDSNCVVIDSIFWDNYALLGTELAVASGFEHDLRPSTLTVSYSDIKTSPNDLWVDDGCTLNWGPGNINKDPLFATGLRGDYYLSQTDVDDPDQTSNSPCVDAGSDMASRLGMTRYTTRTDNEPDTGKVDIGYHYPLVELCRFCDLVYDGFIRFDDFAIFASRWLDEGCFSGNGWCQGADFTFDNYVNFEDLALFAECWLIEDTSAPIPDPSEWKKVPYPASTTSIKMVAKTAYDVWGWDVQYYFDCVYGNCHDSDWQVSPTYEDTGLTAGAEYGYKVKARDGVGNETGWSKIRYAGEDDTTPPAPAPYIQTIDANSPNSIVMVATTASDRSGVQYYFDCNTPGGHDSDWQDEPVYTDTDLDPNTEYCYRVKARDESPRQNETGWSVFVCATTGIGPDTTAPEPNPAQWDPNDLPRKVNRGGGSLDYWAIMAAVQATDPSGVEYKFVCVNNDGFSSEWQSEPEYAEPWTYERHLGGVWVYTEWQVIVRDQSENRNQTGPSPTLPAN